MIGLFFQFARFGAVGLLATLVHVAVGLGLAGAFGIAPLAANFAAFSVAVLVSYLGNRGWTFGLDGSGRLDQLPKFLVTAVLGLALNQALVFVLVERLGWSYGAALAVVVAVVPLVSFAANRWWVFAPART